MDNKSSTLVFFDDGHHLVTAYNEAANLTQWQSALTVCSQKFGWRGQPDPAVAEQALRHIAVQPVGNGYHGVSGGIVLNGDKSRWVEDPQEFHDMMQQAEQVNSRTQVIAVSSAFGPDLSRDPLGYDALTTQITNKIKNWRGPWGPVPSPSDVLTLPRYQWVGWMPKEGDDQSPGYTVVDAWHRHVLWNRESNEGQIPGDPFHWRLRQKAAEQEGRRILKAPPLSVLILESRNYFDQPLGSMVQDVLPAGRLFVRSLIHTPAVDLTPQDWKHTPEIVQSQQMASQVVAMQNVKPVKPSPVSSSVSRLSF